MYDILQLNDMLVPELLDIAEQLKIPNSKKLDKQELVYKILDKQALTPSEKGDDGDDKPKRKRIVKTTTANSSEEAFVESGDPSPKLKKPEPKKDLKKKDEKPIVKKLRKKEDETEIETPAPVEFHKPQPHPRAEHVTSGTHRKQKKEKLPKGKTSRERTRKTGTRKMVLCLSKIARAMVTSSKKCIRNAVTKPSILNSME